MASTPASIQLLKGTWDYVDGENFDAYLQEMGRNLIFFELLIDRTSFLYTQPRDFMGVTSSS